MKKSKQIKNLNVSLSLTRNELLKIKGGIEDTLAGSHISSSDSVAVSNEPAPASSRPSLSHTL